MPRNDRVTWPAHHRIMRFVDPVRQPWLCAAHRRASIPLLLVLGITGCATDSGSRSAIETAKRAAIGMTQADAIRRMGGAGFACAAAPDGVDCSRLLRRGILATCVRHIRLRVDPGSGRVDRIDTPEPACFGGLG